MRTSNSTLLEVGFAELDNPESRISKGFPEVDILFEACVQAKYREDTSERMLS